MSIVKCVLCTLEDLEGFFVELMVVIISSFPEDQILKENLGKYFDDEIDGKSTKDFPEKVLSQVLQHSGMLHLILISENTPLIDPK
jgi:hypothetical protein